MSPLAKQALCASTTVAGQPRIAEHLERMGQQIDPLARLSKRERLIAERFAEGLTCRENGALLHIAQSTMRTHLATIYRKLEIRKKATLVSLVVRRSNAAALSLLALWIEGAIRGTAPKARGFDFPRSAMASMSVERDSGAWRPAGVGQSPCGLSRSHRGGARSRARRRRPVRARPSRHRSAGFARPAQAC